MPALNEERTIGNVVTSLRDIADIIVVNDGSTDRTGAIAAESGAIVVTHEQNQGYDAAINSGFKKGSDLDMDALVTFDADGQHSSENLRQFVRLLAEGHDLVLGTRPTKARFSEFFFAFLTRRRFGIEDPLCGFKGYSISLYRRMGCFTDYPSIGTQLMLFGLTSGAKHIQIPIALAPREDNARFGGIVRANWRIMKAIWLGRRFFRNQRD